MPLGMTSDEYTVMVEPSYDDTTWWMILKQMRGASLPSPARTQVVFFEYTKAWNLGELTEDHVEEILHDWKEEMAANVQKGEASLYHAQVLVEEATLGTQQHELSTPNKSHTILEAS